MINIFSLHKLIAKIKEWYRGKYIPPPNHEPDSPFVVISPGHYEQPPLAKALRRIVKFWLGNWKWILIFLITVAGVIAAFLTLFK